MRKRRPGYHSDANPGRYHAAHRVETANLNPHIKTAPQLGRCIHHEGVNCTPGMQADKWLIKHLGELHHGFPPQRMRRRHDKNQTILSIGACFNTGRHMSGRHHPDLDLPGSNRLNDRRARLLLQTDPDARIPV